MSDRDRETQLKQFVFNGILTKNSMKALEQTGISVEPAIHVAGVAGNVESDFSPRIAYDANKMASTYVAFFCLDNSVRELISSRLLERKGIDWWELAVPDKIRNDVTKLKEKEERNRYHAQRSVKLIGYTTFGNLAQIIVSNWDNFSDLFPDQHWVKSRFNDLEMSRNIIMHTGMLPEIEIERIDSIVRDWLRQVG